MLLESLREEVLHANREIARRGLAPHTFGNASGIDRSDIARSAPRAPRRHQAERRRLRHHDPRRPGRHRSRRQHRRGLAAPLERSRYPHAALPRIPPDRRHRPHPLRVRDLLGAGLPPHPLPRHHPRRLLPRTGSRHRAALPRKRSPKRTCAIPARSSCGCFRSAGARSRGRPGRAGRRPRAVRLGQDSPPKPSSTPTFSSTSPGWRFAVCCSVRLRPAFRPT